MAYASKYYDPVKAHEYYERTKQLKGRFARAHPMSKEEISQYNHDYYENNCS